MPMRSAMFMGSTQFQHKPTRSQTEQRHSASWERKHPCLPGMAWGAKEAGTGAAPPRRGCFYLDRSCEAQIDTRYPHNVAMKKLTIPATGLLFSILVAPKPAPR